MIMRTGKRIRKEKVVGTTAATFAAQYRLIYDAFLSKGFTTDQSFQLLLAVIKKC